MIADILMLSRLERDFAIETITSAPLFCVHDATEYEPVTVQK